MSKYLDIEKIKPELTTVFGHMLTEEQIDYIRSCNDDIGYHYEELKAFQEILGDDLDWFLETTND